MRSRLLCLLLAAALAAPAGIADAQRRPAPRAAAARDWSLVAVRTAEGGFRMGNPAAGVQLIEYFSTTCPHCARFAAEGTPVLIRNYVRTGRVSLEYRNYILNGIDVAAAFISRCAPPRGYFEMSHYLLANQAQWTAGASRLTDAERAEIQALPPLQLARRLIGVLGLDAVAARYGVTPAVRAACLASQARFDELDALAHGGEANFGVTGTPTFVINGRSVGPQTWASLEPMLRAR
jgi:protein-disulfide isomerase